MNHPVTSPRESTSLVLTDAVKRRLLHLRLLAATELAPTVSTVEVQSLERALRLAGRSVARLGDPVLALLANHDATLLRWDLRADAIPGLDEQARAAGMPAEFLGITRSPELVDSVPAVRVGISFDGAQVRLLPVDDDASTVSLEAFLDARINDAIERLRELHPSDEAHGRRFLKVRESDLERFAPALAVPAILPSADRVRHPKFGIGEVLRRQDDRLVVRFDDGVERALLSRFVEPA